MTHRAPNTLKPVEIIATLETTRILLETLIKHTSKKLKPEDKDLLSKAKSNVDKTCKLMNEISNTKEKNPARETLKIEMNDINSIIRDISDKQKPVAEKKRLYFKAKLSPGRLTTLCDTELISKVVRTLILNAIKYTDRGGIVITSNIEKNNNYISVCVKDTGRGLTDREKEKIFLRSPAGAASPWTKNLEGTLDLSQAKTIIARHGGKLWVESHFGRGSTFHFILPIKERRQGR